MPFSHLTDHTETSSRARVEMVREGLAGPAVDRALWIRVGRSRVDELESLEPTFGLEEFEKDELNALKQLLSAETVGG